MDTTKLIEAIEQATANPPQDILARKNLFESTRKLLLSLETEHDLTHRIFFAALPLHATKIGLDLGIFSLLSKNPGKWFPLQEIAEACRCEPMLLQRIIRALAAHVLVAEDGNQRYSANAATETLAKPSVEASIIHNALNAGPDMQYIAPFLKQNGYRNPTDCTDSIFHMAHDTKEDPFAWLAKHPELMEAATTHMWASRTGKPSWWSNDDIVPVQDFTMSDTDVNAGRVLMVDIGGGFGQQCIALRTSQPGFKGRVILEDLATNYEMVDKAKIDELKIEYLTHDFMQPQPVKGAKVYHIRNVMHDWPDGKDLVVLKHARDAMSEDSVLIIDDMVVREDVANWKQVNYDFHSMILSGTERTASQWKRLLGDAGFVIRKMLEYDIDTGDSLIIADPAQR